MIRLNLATDYALRLLLYLATRPEQVVATAEVAEFYRISTDHVAKVAAQLSHAGVIRADRGRRGGLRLARAPERISVGEIVELFEGPMALLECVNTDDVCVIQPGCRLRRVLAEAGTRLMAELRAVSLAELTAAPEPLIQLSPTRG